MMKHKISFSRMKTEQKLVNGDPSWERFTTSFSNCEMDLFTISDEIFMGYSFTTWHKNGRRLADNFILGQHIGLDFDSEDERSSIDYLIKDDFVGKYASLIYTTPSHTPEKPRCRVLFLLDSPIYQAKNYVDAVLALMWLFGGFTIPDRKCKDPCRFFYGSKDCQMEWVDSVLPLDLMIHLIGQYRESGEQVRKKITTDYKPSSASEEEVSSALKVIPAMQIDYDEWLYVLMGIHHQFGDQGMGLAEQWAQGFDGEIPRLWKHLKQAGNGKSPVTIKYLFKQAHQRGWKWQEGKTL